MSVKRLTSESIQTVLEIVFKFLETYQPKRMYPFGNHSYETGWKRISNTPYGAMVLSKLKSSFLKTLIVVFSPSFGFPVT